MGSYAIGTRLCSPNTLFVFPFSFQKGSLKTANWVDIAVTLGSKCHIWVKKGAPTNASKKVAQTDSNGTLFPSPGAPGQPPLKSKIV